MTTRARDAEDVAYLASNARAALALGVTHYQHFDQPVGQWNYIRIANEIEASVPRGTLLDWGCGFGQMTYLLRRRGFDVTAYDVMSQETPLPDVPMSRDLRMIRGQHPTALPFAAESFDAVLSCGVLEHVDEFSATGNELRSLREINRILRPGGSLIIYQLPQRLAWQEAIARHLRVGYWHPRRYSQREIEEILRSTGFHVHRVRRNNMLPKNVAWMPRALRALYGQTSRGLIGLDTALSRVPLLNRVAGVLELMATKARV